MACATNKYDSDRELFENPIHPLLIHIVPPYVNVTNSTQELQVFFHIYVHGESKASQWTCKILEAGENVSPWSFRLSLSARLQWIL